VLLLISVVTKKLPALPGASLRRRQGKPKPLPRGDVSTLAAAV